MLDSIYVGMSGLSAFSKGLQTISNNVANMNTPGFKTSTPQFEDVYYGQRFARNTPGAPALMPYGSGVDYGYASLNMSQGDIRNSSGQLDLAIQGNGFLTLLDGGTPRYVRTGQFTAGTDGFIEDAVSGFKLAALDLSGKPVPISMTDRQISAPKATSVVKFTDNLSPGATDFSIPDVEVYDATGGKHKLTIAFSPDSSIMPGRWKVTVSDEKGLPVTESSLQFVGGIVMPGADTIDLTLTSADAPPLTLKLDFSNGVTNFSAGSTSTLRMADQDGYAAGTLTTMSINDAGQLEFQYSNGKTDHTDSIAIANFADPQQLIQTGKGLFDASHASPPAYGASGRDGAGRLLSSSVEASNVDLSREFGQLILIQRGFQASSQVVTTANEMIMQLFQMRGQS
ncbi:flagellar hook protein FlgE [Caballeronia telluris]|uniref:Flagellar hook protein FlgE n=1 Tax=Caballeronia telluris TaxID=326475 RepID=A0A158ESV8_9BURK|nr:flagellar hook-basal body complex protein [Caballeronia telluris]SAL10625.1 flagellar hook protein FlgE [Caballeronia telluris]